MRKHEPSFSTTALARVLGSINPFHKPKQPWEYDYCSSVISRTPRSARSRMMRWATLNKQDKIALIEAKLKRVRRQIKRCSGFGMWRELVIYAEVLEKSIAYEKGES